MRYVICLVAGLALGSVATAATAGPTIIGMSGYLNGYEIKIGDRKICEDPWVWVDPGGKTGTIECR